MTEFLFWSGALLLAYTYAGYPLLIWLLACIAGRTNTSHDFLPCVSILVIARNEEASITRKLENIVDIDYPLSRLQIVVASDASTDATVQLARKYSTKGIKVFAFETHRGKPAILNEILPQLTGKIVVLMDARQRIDPDVVKNLVKNFSDPSVGAVSGQLHLLARSDNKDKKSGIGFYWRLEKLIRRHESSFDSTVGVTGALYALRKGLFDSIPEDTLLDDVLIPMRIVRKGYRVLFEPTACAWDFVTATPGQEFQRKVRTIGGNFQLFWQHAWLLDPQENRLWVQTVSHKFCRLLSPFCLLLVAVTSTLQYELPFYRNLLVLQGMFYMAALIGHLFPGLALKYSSFSVPHTFCLLNLSTVVGFCRFIRGQQRVTWQQAQDYDSRQ